MRKQTLKKGLAAVLGLALCVQTSAVHSVLQLSAYAQERAATINASSLNVRSGAGTSYSSVGKLGKGTAVTVVGEKAASDGKTWYQIRYTSGGSTQTGYVLSTYVKFPVSYSNDSSFESKLSAQGFPESYKDRTASDPCAVSELDLYGSQDRAGLEYCDSERRCSRT